MKQFSKFKQFADKAFVRPDRTEAMSEEMQEMEKHIDLMKGTCETTVKKMAACVQVSNLTREGTTIARRIKKVPEYALGSSMDEFAKKFESSSVLGAVLADAGKIEMTIGTQMMAYEGKIEPIMTELQKMVDNEFPTISKLKRTLNKLSENMESAKTKLQQANRHSLSASGGKIVDNCKDELEDSQLKVEQCRDNLVTEMYQLMSRETDIAKSIVQFLKYQQEYHFVISNTLSNLLPEVEAALANSSSKPVYGTDLAEHLAASGRSIAYPLEFCVCGLLETGLTEEGLFRIAGSASKVKKLKLAFNVGAIYDVKMLMAEFGDPHVIGNALKCYLRELPNPLLTLELYGEWIDAIRLTETQEKLGALWNVTQKLPTPNRENLRYLIKFLRKISDHQDVNKMSSANIAIVLGPNLLWSPVTADDSIGDSTPMGLNMAMTHWFSSIVEQLVTYADWFFPGEIDFFISCEKPEPEWVSVNLRNVPSPAGSSLPNGNGTEETSEDNQMKRSQSNSSLDEHMTQNGSPKPVIRRKVKPAPLPPTSTKSSEALPKSTEPAMAQQKPQAGDAVKPSLAGKREAMWIPPSPSQLNSNRASYVSQNSPVSIHPKTIPPKPPQPNFSKEKQVTEIVETVSSSTLRHKSSFRNTGKVGSTGSEVQSPGSSPLHYSASLPRRFQTENSYKKTSGAPKPSPKPDALSAVEIDKPPPSLIETDSVDVALSKPVEKVEMAQSKPEIGVGIESEAEIRNKTKNPSTLIGFERIDAEVNSVGGVEKGSGDGDKVVTAGVSPPALPLTEPSRPVPAPRSSLLKETPALQPVHKERPSVMAKPRDLGKRSQEASKTHCRSSSGSGPDSEGEILSFTSSSQPQSRTHSRTGSNVEERKPNDDGREGVKDTRNSVALEEDIGAEPQVTGSMKNPVKMPFRPPRPHPPAPPLSKMKESTDM